MIDQFEGRYYIDKGFDSLGIVSYEKSLRSKSVDITTKKLNYRDKDKLTEIKKENTFFSLAGKEQAAIVGSGGFPYCTYIKIKYCNGVNPLELCIFTSASAFKSILIIFKLTDELKLSHIKFNGVISSSVL